MSYNKSLVALVQTKYKEAGFNFHNVVSAWKTSALSSQDLRDVVREDIGIKLTSAESRDLHSCLKQEKVIEKDTDSPIIEKIKSSNYLKITPSIREQFIRVGPNTFKHRQGGLSWKIILQDDIPHLARIDEDEESRQEKTASYSKKAISNIGGGDNRGLSASPPLSNAVDFSESNDEVFKNVLSQFGSYMSSPEGYKERSGYPRSQKSPAQHIRPFLPEDLSDLSSSDYSSFLHDLYDYAKEGGLACSDRSVNVGSEFFIELMSYPSNFYITSSVQKMASDEAVKALEQIGKYLLEGGSLSNFSSLGEFVYSFCSEDIGQADIINAAVENKDNPSLLISEGASFIMSVFE